MRSLQWAIGAAFAMCVTYVACAACAACGPGELPAFANPPPEPDAGAAKDASADDDAGNAGSESS